MTLHATAWLAVFIVTSLAGSVVPALASREAAEASFDVGVSKVPARFRGNSIEWILRFGTLAPRSASESVSAYTTRRRAFRSEVFALVPDRYDSSYDRGAETLTVTVRPTTTQTGVPASGYYTIYDIHREKLAVSTQAGPSKWSRNDRPVAAERGAVLATRRIWKQTQIVTNEGRYDGSLQPLVLKAKLPRKRVADARILLVCMPRLDQYESAGDPAIPEATGADFQADGSAQFSDHNVTYFVALRCNLLQVWLFDFTTGEIWGRFTPQGVFVPSH